jgi:hypothetical protein
VDQPEPSPGRNTSNRAVSLAVNGSPADLGRIRPADHSAYFKPRLRELPCAPAHRENGPALTVRVDNAARHFAFPKQGKEPLERMRPARPPRIAYQTHSHEGKPHPHDRDTISFTLVGHA